MFESLRLFEIGHLSESLLIEGYQAFDNVAVLLAYVALLPWMAELPQAEWLNVPTNIRKMTEQAKWELCNNGNLVVGLRNRITKYSSPGERGVLIAEQMENRAQKTSRGLRPPLIQKLL